MIRCLLPIVIFVLCCQAEVTFGEVLRRRQHPFVALDWPLYSRFEVSEPLSHSFMVWSVGYDFVFAELIGGQATVGGKFFYSPFSYQLAGAEKSGHLVGGALSSAFAYPLPSSWGNGLNFMSRLEMIPWNMIEVGSSEVVDVQQQSTKRSTLVRYRGSGGAAVQMSFCGSYEGWPFELDDPQLEPSIYGSWGVGLGYYDFGFDRTTTKVKNLAGSSSASVGNKARLSLVALVIHGGVKF